MGGIFSVYDKKFRGSFRSIGHAINSGFFSTIDCNARINKRSENGAQSIPCSRPSLDLLQCVGSPLPHHPDSSSDPLSQEDGCFVETFLTPPSRISIKSLKNAPTGLGDGRRHRTTSHPFPHDNASLSQPKYCLSFSPTNAHLPRGQKNLVPLSHVSLEAKVPPSLRRTSFIHRIQALLLQFPSPLPSRTECPSFRRRDFSRADSTYIRPFLACAFTPGRLQRRDLPTLSPRFKRQMKIRSNGLLDHGQNLRPVA